MEASFHLILGSFLVEQNPKLSAAAQPNRDLKHHLFSPLSAHVALILDSLCSCSLLICCMIVTCNKEIEHVFFLNRSGASA